MRTARRRIAPLSFARHLAALALLIVGPLAAPNVAQAQTPPAACPSVTGSQEWVCNLGESPRGNADFFNNQRTAQAFTTGGTTANEYTLNAVRVRIGQIALADTLSAAIHEAASDGNVGTQLSGGSLSCGAVAVQTAVDCTASGITLTGDTTYYLVPRTDQHTELGTTASTGEPGNSDWSIADTVATSGIDDVWTVQDSTANKLHIGIVATSTSVPGFVFSTTAPSVQIGKPTTDFTLALASRPSANVVVSIENSNSAAVTLSANSLTFTTSNWATPQTTTLTATSSAVAGDTAVLTFGIAAGSSPEYLSASLSANITATVTAAVTAVAAPTFTFRAGHDKSIYVFLAAGTRGDGESAATGFEACAILSDATDFPSALSACAGSGTVSANADPLEGYITGLTNGTAYRAAVRAVDSANDLTSDWVEITGEITDTVTPSLPTLTISALDAVVVEGSFTRGNTHVFVRVRANHSFAAQQTVTVALTSDPASALDPYIPTASGRTLSLSFEALAGPGILEFLFPLADNDRDDGGVTVTATIMPDPTAFAISGDGTATVRIEDDDDTALRLKLRVFLESALP